MLEVPAGVAEQSFVIAKAALPAAPPRQTRSEATSKAKRCPAAQPAARTEKSPAAGSRSHVCKTTHRHPPAEHLPSHPAPGAALTGSRVPLPPEERSWKRRCGAAGTAAGSSTLAASSRREPLNEVALVGPRGVFCSPPGESLPAVIQCSAR